MTDNRFLWISRIPASCAELDLKRTLERFGEVRIRQYLRKESLNYAIAEFPDSKAASRAYKSEDPVSLHGHFLRMEFCNSSGEPGILSVRNNYQLPPHPADPKSSSGRVAFCSLRVSGIPWQQFTEEQIKHTLENEFRQYGRLLSTKLSREVAMITFCRAQDAAKALHSARNGDKTLFCTTVHLSPHPAATGHKEKENVELPFATPPTRTLLISGLDAPSTSGPVTREQITRAFNKFGDILNVRMPCDADSAFIQFSEMKGSVRAMATHARDPLRLGGRLLRLSYVLSSPSTCLWLAELPPGLARLSEKQLLLRLSSWVPVDEVIMISRTEPKPLNGVSNKPVAQHVAAFVRLQSEELATKLLTSVRSDAARGWLKLLSSESRKPESQGSKPCPVDFATARQISVVECHRAKSSVLIGASSSTADSRWEAAAKCPMPSKPIIKTVSRRRHRSSLSSISSDSDSKRTTPATQPKSSSSALTSPLMNGYPSNAVTLPSSLCTSPRLPPSSAASLHQSVKKLKQELDSVKKSLCISGLSGASSPQTSPPAKKSFGYRSSSSVTSAAERTGDYESMYDKIKRRQHKETTEKKLKRSSSSTSTSSDASVTPLIRSSFKASKKIRRKKEGRVKTGKRSRKRGIGCFATSEEEDETMVKRKKAPTYQDVSMVDSFKSSMKEVSQRLVSRTFDEGLNDSYDEFDRYSVSTPSTEAMEQERGSRHSVSSSSSRWGDESIEQKSQKTFDDDIWQSSGNEDSKDKQSPRNPPQDEEDEDAYSPMRSMLGVSIPCVQLKSPALSSTGSLVGGKFNSSTSSQHELSSLLLLQDKAPVDAPKSENPSKSPSVSSPSPAASIGALNCSKWGPDLSSSRSQLSFESKPALDDLNSEFERWRSKQSLPPGVNCATPLQPPKPTPAPPPPPPVTVEKPKPKTKPTRGGCRWSRTLDATEEGAKIGDVKSFVKNIIERVTAESAETGGGASGKRTTTGTGGGPKKSEKTVPKLRSTARAGDPYEPDFDEEVKVKTEQGDNVQRVIDDVAAGKFDAQAYIDSWFLAPRTSTPVQQLPAPVQQPPPPVQPVPPPSSTANNNIISAIVSALNPTTASPSASTTPVIVQVPKPTFSATTITLPAQTAAMVLQASGVPTATTNVLGPNVLNMIQALALKQQPTPPPPEQPLMRQLVDHMASYLLQPKPLLSYVPSEGVLADMAHVWQGRLSLKNSEARVRLHYVKGNTELLQACMGLLAAGGGGHPQQSLIASGGPLRIVQRMRLEPAQLEGVHRKIQQQGASCTCLAFPAGLDEADLGLQTRTLRDSFIRYMQDKAAAGIINVCHPHGQQGLYVVHIFPPCEFSKGQLQALAPAVYVQVERLGLAHLLVVITTV